MTEGSDAAKPPRRRRGVARENAAGSSGINEIAARTGYSISTISRALNGYTDVAEATRARIEQVARELNYRPHIAARSLARGGRSHLVGVVPMANASGGDLRSPFFLEVLDGVQRRLRQSDYAVMLLPTLTDDELDRPRDATLLRRGMRYSLDGAILLGVDESMSEVRELLQSTLPCVAVDMPRIDAQRTAYVHSDNVGGARAAVEHLHRLGRQRIAIISGPVWTFPGGARMQGYVEALHELGLEYRYEYVQEGDFTQQGGWRVTRTFLALKEPPDAIFAAGDLMALGACAAIRDAGLDVPRDVAVVGFDDIELASLASPRLTTIRQDKDGIGEAAAEMLLRMLDDPDRLEPDRTVPVELVVRESCSAPAEQRTPMREFGGRLS